MSPDDQARLNDLVKNYIKPMGISQKVIRAILHTPRHLFVPKQYQDLAYDDQSLPIGQDQTISQPSLVATMVDLLNLKGREKVLEIGTGSGYEAAILAKLASKVYTVEIIPDLAKQAQVILKQLGLKNVTVLVSDGSLGLPKYAPYDAIIVTAGAQQIPQPLIDQLKEGGQLVIPVGETINSQKLISGVKKQDGFEAKVIEGVRFVPLIGEHGWQIG